MENQFEAVSFNVHTHALSKLFRGLSADLEELRQMLIQSPANLGFPDAGEKHLAVLERLKQLFIRNDPVWTLFSAYPTRRVLRILLDATQEAKSAAQWLATNPPLGMGTEGRNDQYAHLCRVLLGAVREWYVFIKADRLLANLDEVLPETLH
jgi:hypothetical protein